jgi:tRNA-dihydrouridine synthase A
VFIVHARNAWLKGLSPKENREVPPLRYELVHRLKREFPQLVIAINGGITLDETVHAQLEALDGVMIGREAYHHPWWLARWDGQFYGEPASGLQREQVEDSMVAYMEREHAQRGTPWHSIARHMMGLYNGLPGARRWRQVWSDHRLKGESPRDVMRLAHERVPEMALRS